MGTLFEEYGLAPSKTKDEPLNETLPVPKAASLYEEYGIAPKTVEAKTSEATQPTPSLFQEYGLPEVQETPSETKESVLASPKDMSDIRKMMVSAKDSYYQTASDDETYDAFMSHMRWLNSNEVYTAKEAIDVYAADDETKMAYGAAYKVYDRIGSILSNGGDLGDKAGAIKDYGQAIITSPSTWAGFIVGKLVGKAGSKVAIKGMEEVIVTAAETAAKQVAKKGGTQAAQTTIKREIVNAAVKVSTKRATLAAAAVEGVVANFQDTLYQDIMMDTGAQEEFSYMQNAVSTLLGGSGAVTSILGHKTLKGASGLADAGKKIEESQVKRSLGSNKAVAKDLKTSIKKVSSDWSELIKKSQGLETNRELDDAIVNWFTDYKTDEGFGAILQRHGIVIKGTDDKTLSKGLIEYASGLDAAERDAISEAFEPLGVTFSQVVQLFKDKVNQAGWTNQRLSSLSKFTNDFKNVAVSNRVAATSVVKELGDTVDDDAAEMASDIIPRPPKLKTPPVKEGFVRFYHGGGTGGLDTSTLDDLWVTTDRNYAANYRKASADEPDNAIYFVDIPKTDAAAVKAQMWDELDEKAGTNIVGHYRETNLPAEWARKAEPERLVDDIPEPISGKRGKELVSEDKQTLAYTMSVWKRMLVSHPATTVANVKGFGIAMAARTAAEAVQMSALYGAAGVKALMGSATAGKTMGEANALLKNISYMTRMAVDPFTTVEAFHALLQQAPKKNQKRVAKQFFQGVDNRGAEAFGLNPQGLVVKKTEGLISLAQRLSFVNAQDVMTKSFSGMKELDKQTRLKFNMGIDEVLNTGRSHEITDDMWEHAIRALEEDTFSKDFRGMKGWGGLGKLADLSQQVSANPLTGFFYPFGQFVNSVIDFGVRYSPLALVPIASKVMKKQIDADLGEKVSQMMVGTAMIGMLTHREKDKREQGLQWNEERDAAGGVYKVDNLFPWGLYNLAGRIGLELGEGEGMNKDLIIAAAQQLSVPAALSNLGNPQVIRDMVAYAIEPSTPDDDKNAFWDLMGYAANSIAPIAAGFTRPLDPLNKFVGAYSDAYGITSNAAVDKKLSPGIEGTIQSFGRYTSTLFDVLLGEPNEDGKLMFGKPKHSATQKGEIRSGNVGAGIFGAQYAQRRTPIDKLLGMVNKAPFKADSFTSGDPEYDDWMNQNVNPILEREATRLMNNKMFMGLPMAGKMMEVDKMLTAARDEVLSYLETSGGKEDRLIAERAKLLARPKNEREKAKEDLGITTPFNKLNTTQIRMIQTKMKLNDKMLQKGIRD